MAQHSQTALMVHHFEPVQMCRPEALYDDLRLTLLKVGQDQIPAMNFNRKLGRGIDGAKQIFLQRNKRSHPGLSENGWFQPRIAILLGKAAILNYGTLGYPISDNPRYCSRQSESLLRPRYGCQGELWFTWCNLLCRLCGRQDLLGASPGIGSCGCRRQVILPKERAAVVIARGTTANAEPVRKRGCIGRFSVISRSNPLGVRIVQSRGAIHSAKNQTHMSKNGFSTVGLDWKLRRADLRSRPGKRTPQCKYKSFIR